MSWLGRWFGQERLPGPIPPAKDVLPVLSAADLFAAPNRTKHVRDIERLAGIPSGHFETLYRCALESFARWVQQLPASEAHHHAGPGGMLDHALEVVVGAMAKRRVHLLPHGADPETITRQQHRWTYAIFSAALLHDIGKPAVDQHIQLFDDKCREQDAWDAWSGPMPLGMWYRVTFIRGRRYRLHEMVSPLLARLILPQAALSWLAQDHEVLSEWLAAIGGDRDRRGVVAEIVEYADGASVAQNLGAGDAARFPTARVVPLHERLLTGLRYLLSTGTLPLNRNGSAGWLVGDDLWLVSKRAIDALRDHLTQEGHSGIPTNNERIFDVLQEHSLLTPNGDRAIWTAEVAGDGWAHPFSLLRFRATRIWPDTTNRPEPFIGTVTPVSVSESRGSSTGQAMVVPACVVISSRQETTETSVDNKNDSPIPSHEPRPASAQDSQLVVPSGDRMSPLENIGVAFLDWLSDGAAKGYIRINQADARLHVVPEGLLLVSPAIFKDYARAINQPATWDRVQGGFCRLGLHRSADDGGNIFHYKVELPDGNHDKATPVLKGIVMMDPLRVLKEAIPPNPILRRTES